MMQQRKAMTTTLTFKSTAAATTTATTTTTTRTRVKTKKMLLIFFILSTFSAFCPLARGLIEIRELNMPERVENATRESIVLDCIYSLDESKDKYKLVVKWFFKDDPVPVYQWIPELNKRTYSPRFANKIDSNFYIPHASPLTKFRALNLVNVTTDLSGTYSCHVASLTSQDSKKKDLIVYASPKKVSFGYKRLSPQDSKALAMSRGVPLLGGASTTSKNGQASPLAASTSSGSVSSGTGGDMSPGAILRCAVENVFPKPDLMIYAIRKDGTRYPVTENVRRREEVSPANRAHSVYLSAQIFDSEISRKYLEDGYHSYSPNYNYHHHSPPILSDQHPFHPQNHATSPDHQAAHRNSDHSSPSSSSSSSRSLSPSSSSLPQLPPNLSSENLDHPPYRFECVSTIDVKLTTGNLTKASSITYTPQSLTAREDSEFFNFKSSSSSAAHRPNRLLPASLFFISIFIFITPSTVKLSLSTASFYSS